MDVRWIWIIVVVCLAAASDARPDLEAHDSYDAQARPAEHLRVCATRRAPTHSPELQLPAFIVVAQVSLPAALFFAALDEQRGPSCYVALVAQPCSARGPPIA